MLSPAMPQNPRITAEMPAGLGASPARIRRQWSERGRWMVLRCPSYGDSRVKQVPTISDRDDYDCLVCHAFSVSGADRAAIANGASSRLVLDGSGRVWLRPDHRIAQQRPRLGQDGNRRTPPPSRPNDTTFGSYRGSAAEHGWSRSICALCCSLAAVAKSPWRVFSSWRIGERTDATDCRARAARELDRPA
jgi:hypothetical protein